MRFSLGFILTGTLFSLVGLCAFQVIAHLSLVNELQRLNLDHVRQSILLSDLAKNPQSLSADEVQKIGRVVNRLRTQVL